MLADCAEDHATIGADEIGFVVAVRQWVSLRTPRQEHGVDIVSGQRTTCEAGEAQAGKLASSNSAK